MTDTSLTSTLNISYGEIEGAVAKTISIDGHTSTNLRKRSASSSDLAADWATGFLRGVPIRSATPRSRSIRSAELFCGSGGLGLGVREAALELGLDYASLACLDHDPDAVEVYAANHGSPLKSACSATEIVDYNVSGQGESAEFLYDPEILDPNWLSLEGRVDVLMAGPPCQGHSNLNNRTRRTDKRNQLYLTVPAIAVALQVEAVIIENVQAVVHDRSEVVASTIQLLQTAGYTVETGVISALSTGWPQTRKRFFLIARRGSAPLPISAVMDACIAPRNLRWAIDGLGPVNGSDDLHVSVDLSEENRRRIDSLTTTCLICRIRRPECQRMEPLTDRSTGGCELTKRRQQLRLDF